MTKVAYSYIRFSSKKQEVGDSLRRQMALSEKYCADHGWELSEKSYRDLGISAFKLGAKRASLEDMLTAVQQGHIQRGSVIIIEQIDRLSRAGIAHTQDVIKSILRFGVEIVSIEDNLHLTSASLNDLASVMQIALAADLAHRESAKKSERLLQAKGAQRAQAAQGKPINKRLPLWLERTETGYALDAERAAIVRTMIDMRLRGNGYHNICKHLTAINALPDRAKSWTQPTIRNILANPALYGAYAAGITQPDRTVLITQITENYYPALITKDVFNQLQGLKQKPGKRGTAEIYSNPLRGVAKCAVCGSALKVYRRYDKRYDRMYSYLACPDAGIGNCTNTGRPHTEAVAAAIAQHLHGLTTQDLTSGINTAQDRASITADIDQCTRVYKRLEVALQHADAPVDAIMPLYTDAKNKLDAANQRLTDYDTQYTAITEHRAERYSTVPVLDDYEGRERFNADICRLVHAIRIDAVQKDNVQLMIDYEHKCIPMHIITLDDNYNVKTTYKHFLDKNMPYSAGVLNGADGVVMIKKM